MTIVVGELSADSLSLTDSLQLQVPGDLVIYPVESGLSGYVYKFLSDELQL